MNAEIHTLINLKHFEVVDFKCKCLECATSPVEYQETFSICFIRTGNFYFNAFKNSFDAYNGHILINKPGYDYSVSHVAEMPDECTIIRFKNEIYEEMKETYKLKNQSFFSNENLQSCLIKTTPDLESIHTTLLSSLKDRSYNTLLIEQLVNEMLDGLLMQMTKTIASQSITSQLKKNHLKTIESAKAYINEHFTKDISLYELANYCHISPFHLSRIFKSFTNFSPNQFLQSIRLKHAEIMIKSTLMPITDIAFASGFNSIDYFSSAFKRKFKSSPSSYRSKKAI